MTSDFLDRMRECGNAALIDIVTVKKDQYQPDAVAAAQQVLDERGVTLPEIATQVQQARQDFDALDLLSRRVSSLTRFAHMVMDAICYLIIWALLMVVFGIVFQPKTQQEILVATYLLLLVAFTGYYGFMESVFGKTVGKFATRSSVVTLEGARPTTANIMGRTLSRLIPFDNITFLFMKNGIHDHFSGTIVVKD